MTEIENLKKQILEKDKATIAAFLVFNEYMGTMGEEMTKFEKRLRKLEKKND